METVKVSYFDFCRWAMDQNWLEIDDEIGNKRYTTWLTPFGLKVKAVFDEKGFVGVASASMSVNRV
jgi:hypothetical protein